MSLRPARRPALAVPLSALVLVLSAACQGGARPTQDVPELPEPPSIVEPTPDGPTPADQGHRGTWEPLEGPRPAVRAFVVEAADRGPAPGILLVHGTWGVTSEVRALARQISSRGAVVCVPDLYEGVVSSSRVSAPELLASVAAPRAAEILAAGLRRLNEHPRVKGRPVAVLALGQGARWAVPFVREAADVSGLALDNPPPELLLDAPLAPRVPLLILAGEQSSVFTDERRAELDASFGAAGVKAKWETVPEAGTDLLDPRALGFSRRAYELAVGRLTAFVTSLG